MGFGSRLKNLFGLGKTGSKNFKYLDGLIHSGVKEIILDSDIVLGAGEESEYLEGIKLDVDDLVIDGKGHVISAERKTRIFEVNGNNITIKNITLKNGFAEETKERFGGAIHNSGELTIAESTLNVNVAGGGGAICNDGGKLTLTGSTLTENTAGVDGGAIWHNDGELIIRDSMFKENKAGFGGSILNCSKLTIIKSIFNKNSANYRGGVIYDVGGEFTITDSTFNENVAQQEGGVIYNMHNFKCVNCNFIDNESENSIIFNGDSFRMYDCLFMKNYGGCVILNDGDLSNAYISRGEFKNHTIIESVIFNNGKSCTIEKSIFKNNHSNTILNKSDLTLINPEIKDECKTILNEKYILIKSGFDGLINKIYGEGIVENKIITFQDDKFDFGYLDKKIHESTTKEIILKEDISFENYEIDYYEGGIELDIDNLIIDGNGHTIDAQEKTRIFYCTGNNITLKNITFKNGHTHRSYDNLFNSSGGAIKITNKIDLTIKNCQFINNISEENGGAIYTNGKLTIKESTFKENTSNIHGGAIDNSGELSVSESLLEGNTAKWVGGAIYSNGKLTIIDSYLNGNTSFRIGGAICNRGDKLIVSGSAFTGNTTEDIGGGAIYNWEGELSILDSTFNKNVAKLYGSSIYLNIESGKYELNNCTFQGKLFEVYDEENNHIIPTYLK